MYCPLRCHMFTSLFLYVTKSIRCIRLLMSKPTLLSPFPLFHFISMYTNTRLLQCPTLTWKVEIYTCVLKTAWDKHIKIMRRIDSLLVFRVVCENFLCVKLMIEKSENQMFNMPNFEYKVKAKSHHQYHLVTLRNNYAFIFCYHLQGFSKPNKDLKKQFYFGKTLDFVLLSWGSAGRVIGCWIKSKEGVLWTFTYA